MDPNEVLRQLREWTTLAFKLNPSDRECSDYAALSVDGVLEKVRSLDEWLTKGGFLPDAWRAGRPTGP